MLYNNGERKEWNSTMKFVNQIWDNNNAINATERKIVQYMVSNIDLVKNMTIQELADSQFVAPNTVLRLCKKLGFSGFSELKMAIRLELSEGNTTQPTMSIDHLISKTKSLLRSETVQEVANIINVSEKIIVLAMGLSRISAQELVMRLQHIGKDVQLYTDSHVMYFNAKKLSNKDAVIVVSVTGETEQPVKASYIAKEKGATVISLTGLSQNRMSAISDVQLYGMVDPIYVEGIDVAHRISFTYILSEIFQAYVLLSNKKINSDKGV